MPEFTAPLALARGPDWGNRLALAPLTNQQSHLDGTLSEAELRWLTMRASGGFGLTMTCAAQVQPSGQGFAGQLGAFAEKHLDGLTRLADAIRAAGSVSAIQLHHAGIRADKDLVPVPVGASDDAETGARALSIDDVIALRDDFVAAAVRAERAGFDGAEVHGAHGYLLTQFLSSETNRRTDRYGGSFENRARLLLEVLDGIRASCAPHFQLGIRLSVERFGLVLGEMRDLVAELFRAGTIDYIDLSLWDTFKDPEDGRFEGSLLSQFTRLDRGQVRIGVAGRIDGGSAVRRALDEGADFVLMGRAAIAQHDFAARLLADPTAQGIGIPFAAERLEGEGVTSPFLAYLRTFPGFVA